MKPLETAIATSDIAIVMFVPDDVTRLMSCATEANEEATVHPNGFEKVPLKLNKKVNALLGPPQENPILRNILNQDGPFRG